MRLSFFLVTAICFVVTACKKPTDNSNNKPKSKIDYIPIISAKTPRNVVFGQSIVSRVKMGFYTYSADVTFLNFEIKESALKQYNIKVKGFYDNIVYDFSLPVVATFDTTLNIQPMLTGQYLLKFYSAAQLIQTDTVQVN